jgi:methylated-DNA-[protein]-cysteine S-methyltransferase
MGRSFAVKGTVQPVEFEIGITVYMFLLNNTSLCFCAKGLDMPAEEFVHYYSKAVGWLELRVSAKGVRSISFVAAPKRPVKSTHNPLMKKLVSELDQYFTGSPITFSVPLDPASGTAFQRRVWKQLALIPYGNTRSYVDIARKVDCPRGSRAVGLANKNNPIPILIPCHRVIKADGKLGGYNSGVEIKKSLLELEGVRW